MFLKNEKTDKIAGVLDLTCVKIDILQNVEGKQVDAGISEPLQGFRFMRNGKVIEI